MRYEVSARVSSSKDLSRIQAVLKSQFVKVAKNVDADGDLLIVNGIENTLGSINRVSIAHVTASPVDGGYLLIADVDYHPSIMFWIFLLVGLFAWVLWLVPVCFYLLQKSSVRTAIENVFERVKDEFYETTSKDNSFSAASEIAALHELQTSGVITIDEFNAKKAKLLQ